MALFLGIDIGTSEVRCALVTKTGDIKSETRRPLRVFRDADNEAIFEQSTDDIWSQICSGVQEALRTSRANSENVKGIGIDSTCSLALSDSLSLKRTDGLLRDVILWRDQRAKKEAEVVNASGSDALTYTGGTQDAELEIPRLLWLKKNMPAEILMQGRFMPLCDRIVERMTGSVTRSTSSLYGYVPRPMKDSSLVNRAFLSKIGLDEKFEPSNEANGLILTAGQPVGAGLHQNAAAELGLSTGVAVGSGLIDSHAGWLGVIATSVDGRETSLATSCSRLVIIAGTSTCFVVQGQQTSPIKGIWGPLASSVFPGYWMHEGGQPAAGALIDHIIDSHPASTELEQRAKESGISRYQALDDVLHQLSSAKSCSMSELTRHLSVYPDFAGNRTPLADAQMVGAIIGLTLDTSLNALARLYFATLEALAFQTRQHVELFNGAGHCIKELVLTGGLVRNRLLMQLIADVCQLPIILPVKRKSAVVLGAAICGRIAAIDALHGRIEPGQQAEADRRAVAQKERVWRIMSEMSPAGAVLKPAANDAKLLDRKYGVFQEMIEFQRRRSRMITDSATTSI